MTQNLVSFCRLNADTPKEIIYKVVGEEIVKKIHDNAAKEEHKGQKRKVENVMKCLEEASRVDTMIRHKLRRSILHKILGPVETAWAFCYACVLEWSKMSFRWSVKHFEAACSAVIKFSVKRDWIKEVYD